MAALGAGLEDVARPKRSRTQTRNIARVGEQLVRKVTSSDYPNLCKTLGTGIQCLTKDRVESRCARRIQLGSSFLFVSGRGS
jgi:hypothetical protein